jgi:hypothetical protein
MKKIKVFDNGGETFDRFTIVNLEDGEVYGASENPFHPQGFGQFCGNVVEFIGDWRYRLSEFKNGRYTKRAVKSCFKTWVSDWKDKEIDFNSLPADVQQYCKQIAI